MRTDPIAVRTCEFCGAPIVKPENESVLAYSKRRFCNRTCFGQYNQAQSRKTRQDLQRRAERAEGQLATAQGEIVRLKGLLASFEAHSESDSVYSVTDIELVRLRRTLAALRASGETHAALICRVLDTVARIDREAQAIAGIGRGKRVRAA